VYFVTLCVLFYYVCVAVLHTLVAGCWLEVSIRKVLRPTTSAQVFLGFLVSISMRFLSQVKPMEYSFIEDWQTEKTRAWYNNKICSQPKNIRVSILVLSVLYNSFVQKPSLDTKFLQMVKCFLASY